MGVPSPLFRFRSLLALMWLALAALSFAEMPTIARVASQSEFTLESPITDLSGLAWGGGDSFYAVSDKRSAILPVTLRIDPATGAITSGEFGAPMPVPAKASDFEGVAYFTESRRFFVATESPPSVFTYRVGEAGVRNLPLPPIFARARKGLGMESLTRDAKTQHFWTANEEALASDGPVSDVGAGTVVRLLELDATFRPRRQYAWRTETAAMRYGSGCGVSDLLLLPDGTLVVMERGFIGLGLSVRLYAADFAGATDVSQLDALDGATFTPARKTLLFGEPTGFTNFEGLALGPMLADGTRSLILVADSNGETRHVFLPLKIRLPTARTK